MKKLILAGIIIIICCLVFLIVRQNSSRADIGMDISMKPYPVPFGDWVEVWLNSLWGKQMPDYVVFVAGELIEDKVRFKMVAMYNTGISLPGKELAKSRLLSFPLFGKMLSNRAEVFLLFAKKGLYAPITHFFNPKLC